MRGRLVQIPTLLATALDRLETPSTELTELAILQAEALGGFLLHGVQPVAVGSRDLELTDSVLAATSRALGAVWEYREALVRDVLPRARPGFALGDSLYRAALAVEEGVDRSIPELDNLATAELARLEGSLRVVASAIDSTRPPTEVLRSMASDHPGPEGLLDLLTTATREAREFVEASWAFPPISEGPTLRVRPAPRFVHTGFAGLFLPGPFSRDPIEGQFFVVFPDRAAPDEDREAALRFFHPAAATNLALHETYPGHFYQLAHLRTLPSPIRRAVMSRSFIEGWAHYGESVVLELGYRLQDSAFRLATLHSALRRAGRLRVALGLHTEGWTLDEAAVFLETRCFLDPPVAWREAERGMTDPFYGVYTLGRLAIEQLRREVEQVRGDDFDLGVFHGELLGMGAPPLSLAREALLGAGAVGGYLD